MIRITTNVTGGSRYIRRFYSSHHGLTPVHTTTGPLASVDVKEFREKAFDAQQPLLIAAPNASRPGTEAPPHSIPAADKWFTHETASHGDQLPQNSRRTVLNQPYLSQFGDTVLPYELVTASPIITNTPPQESSHLISAWLEKQLQQSSGITFHRFTAPLSLFLHAACITPVPWPPALYIAQAQVIDLPPALRADLPTPHLVLKAGKGDVYDSNIWLGIPPTYTPLHRDPNPNLFVQLASRKRVRVFRPQVGDRIFRNVRQMVGVGRGGGSASMRGEEMMEGPESGLLQVAVWGDCVHRGGVASERDMDAHEEEGFEAVVRPGDALFIPKGWWHSFMSEGGDVTGSVNWWFR
ncbi:hypothetical protein LZ554_005035 [Drepanopeziza brunnea f. sp. 'monogermtubi']|nr:hypothetical protein LZ554_005035 [Drepanopeziza brunnea f. sp. 'monogermtubi']